MEATKTIRDKVKHLVENAYSEKGWVLDKFYEHANSGCSRTVIIDAAEGVVYKLALRTRDAVYNKNEWKTWKKLPPEAQLITAQPLAISPCGMVLAMEFIGTTLAKSHNALMLDEIDLIQCDFNKYLNLCLSELFTEEEIEDMTCDNHTGNMAYREDGSLAWIDYGGLE